MSDLAARLEALFRRCAAASDLRQSDGGTLAEQFRKEVDLLVVEYGQPAINAALEESAEAWPSTSLH
jgi:hypothetical protein